MMRWCARLLYLLHYSRSCDISDILWAPRLWRHSRACVNNVASAMLQATADSVAIVLLLSTVFLASTLAGKGVKMYLTYDAEGVDKSSDAQICQRQVHDEYISCCFQVLKMEKHRTCIATSCGFSLPWDAVLHSQANDWVQFSLAGRSSLENRGLFPYCISLCSFVQRFYNELWAILGRDTVSSSLLAFNVVPGVPLSPFLLVKFFKPQLLLLNSCWTASN